jgi:GNAT superfamily N-acetyltransferase
MVRRREARAVASVAMQDAEVPDGYPGELVEIAWLDDGVEVLFRPILPEDAVRYERLFTRLSPETLYRRFLTPIVRIDRRLLRHLVTVDYRKRLAIVAVIDDEIVGVARYDETGPGIAEVALVVEDAWQGRGIGSRLLWRISAAARRNGLEAFEAEVLGENRPMMGLLHVLSENLETRMEGGLYIIRIDLGSLRRP